MWKSSLVLIRQKDSERDNIVVKIFDIVDAYIKNCDDVNNGCVIDTNKYDILRTYCEVMDEIMEVWGGSAIEVNIVTKRRFVCISLEVDTFTAMTIDQHYFDVIERCVCFATGITDNQMVRMDFTFPSVFK